MEIKEYLDEYTRITDEMTKRGVEKVSTASFELALAILGERAKDRRMSEIAEERKGEQAEPITPKQKTYIESLCALKMEPVPLDLSEMSKSDASALIKKLKAEK